MPATIPVPARGRAAAAGARWRANIRDVNRRCYRVGCQGSPVATLTYNYARSTATVGPLSPEHDPGGYDLCLEHARHLQVPSGWNLERVQTYPERAPASASWLSSLADDVRRIGWRDDPPRPADDAPDPAGVVELTRRGHLRVIADRSSTLDL